MRLVSLSLAVLCLAAFGAVAVPVSALVAAALPAFDRLAVQIAPRHRVRLWLALSLLPCAIALLAITAALLPAVGIGHDHCLAHDPHHPHLCPEHVGSAPGMALFFVAGLVAARAIYELTELVRGLRSSRATAGCILQASDRHEDVRIFPSSEPRAFVLGILRPRVHLSRGLLSLGREVVEPVLAHERVHARHRDLLWRALCPMLGIGHVPSVTSALGARLATAQEMAADAEAAESLPEGRLRIAEALVLLATLSRRASSELAFTHGDLEARVHALLKGRTDHASWPPRLLVLGGLLMPVIVAGSHAHVHHGLEMLLGILS